MNMTMPEDEDRLNELEALATELVSEEEEDTLEQLKKLPRAEQREIAKLLIQQETFVGKTTLKEKNNGNSGGINDGKRKIKRNINRANNTYEPSNNQ